MTYLKYLSAFTLTSLLSLHASANDALHFEPLFVNDADLDIHWEGPIQSYDLKDNVLSAKAGCGLIFSKKEYNDYLLRFEFKLASGSNNGIGLRAPKFIPKSKKNQEPAYSSIEVQILDDSAKKYENLKDYQFHGSAYGLIPAKRGHLNALGEWNTQSIELKGNKIKITLNGVVITEGDLSEGTPDKGLAAGRNRAAGHIVIAGHGPGVSFRNMEIAELNNNSSLAPAANKTPAGFTSLFNGTDLSNWKGLLAAPYDKPHKRKNLTVEKINELQAAADAVMNKHWSVQDGILQFDGAKGGTSLATIKQYKDFEFHASWKIEAKGDSGIYLRGLPQVQIWDPANPAALRHGANKGSGGLWNNPSEGKWPLVLADNPVGEWNHFYIRMLGDKVSIWLNGRLTVNNAPLYNLWEKGAPIPLAEQIELQCHGHPVYFKNLFIRELN